VKTRRRASQPSLSLALAAGWWVLSCNAVLGIEEFSDRDEPGGDGGSVDRGEGSGGGTDPSRGGMGDPGTGGTSGGNSIAAGGNSNGECDLDWSVGNDGFVQAKSAGTACWHGYAFVTATPTSFAAPMSFDTCGEGCMLCFKGSVGATLDDVALIGFNLSQSPDSITTATVKPTGTGLTISFTKTGTFPLRVQIQAATAAIRWCYTIPETATSPVTIPYAMFNTECWEGGAGKAYAKEDIEAIMLLIPGNAVAATPFGKTCLTGVAEN
jgi:hypothetical protein